MPAATDLHAYSSNQAAWGMDEKRKKQPPQATITINPAMGRTPKYDLITSHHHMMLISIHMSLYNADEPRPLWCCAV